MNKELFRQIGAIRPILLGVIVLGVLETLVMLVQMTLLTKSIALVFMAHQTLAQVACWLYFLLVAIIVHALLVWLHELIAQEGALRAKSQLRERLFAHLLQLGPAYCKGERTGELVTVLADGIERLDAYISRYIPQMYLSVLVPLLIAGYILLLDWSSALLLLMTAPIIPLLMVLVGSYAEAHIQQQWSSLSRMSAHFLDVLQGLPTLKIFGRSGAQREQVRRISDGFRDKTLKVLRVAFLSGFVLEFIAIFAIALVAVALGIRLLNGGISFERALLILVLAPEFYRPLRELGVQRHAGMEGKAAFKRIAEILNTPASITTLTETDARPGKQLAIEFKHIHFTYPASTQPALADVTILLPANTCTALVGKSGSGKSTLVNLLLRFMDAQNGTITVNGLSLNTLPVEVWREYVALVPQRPYLFYGTVSANIRLARPTASDEEVRQAADLAGASEFIAQLPQGYSTEIGERGARLSAGQVQRLAIARAFLKDAPLLILDEPTSSLDPRSETLIREALQRLVRQRTVLIIAHRYNTISHADQVIMLDKGRIVEADSSSTLLAAMRPYLFDPELVEKGAGML